MMWFITASLCTQNASVEHLSTARALRQTAASNARYVERIKTFSKLLIAAKELRSNEFVNVQGAARAVESRPFIRDFRPRSEG
jgi:hypothetical protein